MDASGIYQNLMERARTRPKLPVYTENHHIIPRSMGGKGLKDNIVRLTFKEHRLAHLLLVRMTLDQPPKVRRYLVVACNAFKRNA